jgi:hypothetical protein
VLYHFIENYLIGPKVYGRQASPEQYRDPAGVCGGSGGGWRDWRHSGAADCRRVSTIERHWLRDQFGSDVIEEHAAVTSEGSRALPRRKNGLDAIPRPLRSATRPAAAGPA